MAAFYPGVPDAALATPVRVSAGDELAGIDVRLASKETYTISGRVIGPSQISGFRDSDDTTLQSRRTW